MVLKEKISRIRFDIIVLGFFKDVRPLRGIAADIDWIYSGAISRMITGGRISGERDEAFLMATSDKMASPRLLLLGLGEKASFSYSAINEFSLNLTERLIKLRLGGCAAEIPGTPDSRLDKFRSFDLIISGFRGDHSLDMAILVKDDKIAEELEERIPI